MDAPKIRYVSATLTNSCVPACLAMVTGKTLNRVIKDIYEYWEDEGRSSGVGDNIIDQYLAQSGFAVQRLNHDYEPNMLLIDNWPVDPFAPVHMVDVWAEGMHSVVMDGAGLVYDPTYKRNKSLSVYQRVFSITGIWKVTNPLIDIN